MAKRKVAETTVERYSFAKALDVKLLSESKAETVFDLNREEIMYKVVIPMMRDCS